METDKEHYKQRMKEKAISLYCPFKDCEDYEETGKGNIVFIRKYGVGDTQNLFKCKSCERTFSERRGTLLFNCKLKEEKVYQILKCLAEGNGVRATARIVGVNKNTVGSVIERVGEHMEKVTEYLLQEYHLKEWQLDELRSFVFKKRKIQKELRGSTRSSEMHEYGLHQSSKTKLWSTL